MPDAKKTMIRSNLFTVWKWEDSKRVYLKQILKRKGPHDVFGPELSSAVKLDKKNAFENAIIHNAGVGEFVSVKGAGVITVLDVE